MVVTTPAHRRCQSLEWWPQKSLSSSMTTLKMSDYPALISMGISDGSHWDLNNMKRGTITSGERNEIIYCSAPATITTGAMLSNDVSRSVAYWEIKVAHGEPMTAHRPTIRVGVVAFDFSQQRFRDSVVDFWEMDNEGYKRHNGNRIKYGDRIPNFTTYGLLYNGNTGTLEFIRNGIPLGRAFENVFSEYSLKPIFGVSGGRAIAIICRSRRVDLSLSAVCKRFISQNRVTYCNVALDQLPATLCQSLKRLPCGCFKENHGQDSRKWYKLLPSLSSRRLLKRATNRCYFISSQ